MILESSTVKRHFLRKLLKLFLFIFNRMYHSSEIYLHVIHVHLFITLCFFAVNKCNTVIFYFV